MTSWQVSWLSALTEVTRKLNWVHVFDPSLLAIFPVWTSEAALLQAFRPCGTENMETVETDLEKLIKRRSYNDSSLSFNVTSYSDSIMD